MTTSAGRKNGQQFWQKQSNLPWGSWRTERSNISPCTAACARPRLDFGNPQISEPLKLPTNLSCHLMSLQRCTAQIARSLTWEEMTHLKSIQMKPHTRSHCGFAEVDIKKKERCVRCFVKKKIKKEKRKRQKAMISFFVASTFSDALIDVDQLKLDELLRCCTKDYKWSWKRWPGQDASTNCTDTLCIIMGTG